MCAYITHTQRYDKDTSLPFKHRRNHRIHLADFVIKEIIERGGKWEMKRTQKKQFRKEKGMNLGRGKGVNREERKEEVKTSPTTNTLMA